MLGGPAGPRKIARGVDQADVREGLREVADEPSRVRIVLLGQEADVVADVEEALEERAGLGPPPLQGQIVGEPERARQKRPFARREPVQVRRRLVARHQPIAREMLPDGLDGPEHARIHRRKKSDERNDQKARTGNYESVWRRARSAAMAASR